MYTTIYYESCFMFEPHKMATCCCVMLWHSTSGDTTGEY